MNSEAIDTKFDPAEWSKKDPILGSTLHWRIVDARRGPLAEGHAKLSELMQRKPWDYGEVSST